MLKYVFVLVLSCAIHLSASAGGGWVKSKGTGYYKIGQSWVGSSGYFGGPGLFSPTLNSSLYTTSLYAEHGLGDGVSVEGYLPFFVRHSIDGQIIEDGDEVVISDAVNGIGDANLGLRVSLLKRDFLALSGTFTLGLPLGRAIAGERNNLFTGDGEFNQIIRMDVSAPFGGKKVGGYATLYGGFNNRTDNFSNELLYGGEIGISALESKLWLIGRYNAIDAGRTNSATDFQTNTFAASASFSTVSGEVAFMLSEKVGFTVSYTGSVSGNVLLVAPTYAGGIFLNLN